MNKKDEPNPALCFDGLNQKTTRQGEDHDSTKVKERWRGGIGQDNSIGHPGRFCQSA